jgi:hypothetical protein
MNMLTNEKAFCRLHHGDQEIFLELHKAKSLEILCMNNTWQTVLGVESPNELDIFRLKLKEDMTIVLEEKDSVHGDQKWMIKISKINNGSVAGRYVVYSEAANKKMSTSSGVFPFEHIDSVRPATEMEISSELKESYKDIVIEGWSCFGEPMSCGSVIDRYALKHFVRSGYVYENYSTTQETPMMFNVDKSKILERATHVRFVEIT